MMIFQADSKLILRRVRVDADAAGAQVRNIGLIALDGHLLGLGDAIAPGIPVGPEHSIGTALGTGHDRGRSGNGACTIIACRRSGQGIRTIFREVGQRCYIRYGCDSILYDHFLQLADGHIPVIEFPYDRVTALRPECQGAGGGCRIINIVKIGFRYLRKGGVALGIHILKGGSIPGRYFGAGGVQEKLIHDAAVHGAGINECIGGAVYDLISGRLAEVTGAGNGEITVYGINGEGPAIKNAEAVAVQGSGINGRYGNDGVADTVGMHVQPRDEIQLIGTVPQQLRIGNAG